MQYVCNSKNLEFCVCSVLLSSEWCSGESNERVSSPQVVLLSHGVRSPHFLRFFLFTSLPNTEFKVDDIACTLLVGPVIDSPVHMLTVGDKTYTPTRPQPTRGRKSTKHAPDGSVQFADFS